MSRILLPFVAFSLVTLSACAGSKGDDTAGGGGGSNGGGGGDSQQVDDSVAPSIVSVDSVQCAEYQSAGESWDIALTVDDPQGAETVRDGSISVLNADGGELAAYTLACGNGQCFGSFRAAYDGIGCSMQDSITLRFTVVDADGHSSASVDYP